MNYVYSYIISSKCYLRSLCTRLLIKEYVIDLQRLSFGENWLVYEGEASGKPLFTGKKHVNILNKRCLTQLLRCEDGHKKKEVAYEVEGSYSQRCCAVFDNKRRKVAEIKKKEAVAGGVAFGADIFRLIVQPDMDTTLAMAFVILLDQMFGS